MAESAEKKTLVVADRESGKTYAIPRDVLANHEIEGDEVEGFAGNTRAVAAPYFDTYWSADGTEL